MAKSRRSQCKNIIIFAHGERRSAVVDKQLLARAVNLAHGQLLLVSPLAVKHGETRKLKMARMGLALKYHLRNF